MKANIMNGKKVRVNNTGVTGTVLAELKEHYGHDQVRIRYVSKNESVIDDWFYVTDVEIVD